MYRIDVLNYSMKCLKMSFKIVQTMKLYFTVLYILQRCTGDLILLSLPKYLKNVHTTILKTKVISGLQFNIVNTVYGINIRLSNMKGLHFNIFLKLLIQCILLQYRIKLLLRQLSEKKALQVYHVIFFLLFYNDLVCNCNSQKFRFLFLQRVLIAHALPKA